MDYLLLGLLVAGAVGLYVALPRPQFSVASAALMMLGGAAALFLLLIQRNLAPGSHWGTFSLFSIVALLCGIRVITHKKAVYSALYFVLVVVSMAALLVLMQATFLAVALVVIYAGAILVTYVFVIMLAQQSGGPPAYDKQSREPLLGVLAGFVLLAGITAKLLGPTGDAGSRLPEPTASPESDLGTVNAVGTSLLTQYAVGVEVAGVLLLAAMVGAIVIARRRAEGGADAEAA
jgi:NADH-quinone oxidoreductase subunit J